jgi:hypothetical protein
MSDDQRHDITRAWRCTAFNQKSCWSACLPWSSNRQPTASPTIKARALRSVIRKSILLAGLENGRAVAASLVAILTAIAAITTLFISAKTLQANTRQQTSDRFVKAIEQLGNKDSPDVRLGGIYGLEQLARDEPSDHPSVFDVLTAFVRGQAPAGSGKCTDPTLHLGLPDQSPNASPSVDVQAAIDAIARRNRQNDRNDQTLDLSDTCLVAAGWFTHFQLPGLLMNRADLRYAVLNFSDLRQTYFAQANLTGASLIEVDLAGARLTLANLSGADLGSANLTHAFLLQANLTRADLGSANLTNALLANANLTGANLKSANLTGAFLGGVNLTEANLNDIDYDKTTTWPDGFQPPPRKSH